MPNANRPSSLTIHQLRNLIQQETLHPRELLEDVLAQIAAGNPALHAYIAVEPERITRQLEEHFRQRSTGRLFGVPITIKDNLCLRDEETTCASRILAGFRPPYTATAVERLIHEGAVIIPRANMDEFAFGSSTETSAAGLTRNPWDPQRVPGGSSGGSAAAVAADLAIGALGTDTGGSIRQPAAFCGVVGLKPTYGRVSRYGLIAFASSLDQIGPFAKNVADAARLLQVIAGFDPRDSTSGNVPVPDYLQEMQRGAKGLRLGVPKECFGRGVDPEVNAALQASLEQCRKLGMIVKEISLPGTEYAIPTYYIVATAEASSNLARFDGVQYGYRSARSQSILEMYNATRGEGFGAEVKRRIILGTFVLSSGYYDTYYGHALKVRTLIKNDFDRAFQEVDCVITPTAPTPPFRLGEKLEDPLTMYLSDIFTISVNMAGLPGVSIPCGFTKSGLPIGMQWIGRPFEEPVLFRGAHAYEQASGWHARSPQLS